MNKGSIWITTWWILLRWHGVRIYSNTRENKGLQKFVKSSQCAPQIIQNPHKSICWSIQWRQSFPAPSQGNLDFWTSGSFQWSALQGNHITQLEAFPLHYLVLFFNKNLVDYAAKHLLFDVSLSQWRKNSWKILLSNWMLFFQACVSLGMISGLLLWGEQKGLLQKQP